MERAVLNGICGHSEEAARGTWDKGSSWPMFTVVGSL